MIEPALLIALTRPMIAAAADKVLKQFVQERQLNNQPDVKELLRDIQQQTIDELQGKFELEFKEFQKQLEQRYELERRDLELKQIKEKEALKAEQAEERAKSRKFSIILSIISLFSGIILKFLIDHLSISFS